MGVYNSIPLDSTVSPGEMVDISVSLQAPTLPGDYRGNFKLRDQRFNRFGTGLNADNPIWVEIEVQDTQQIAYDFSANLCNAYWVGSGGALTCPAVEGDPNGYMLGLSTALLEDGSLDPRPAILTAPQNVENGYIIGIFPEHQVQTGEHFQATVSCEKSAADCQVVLRLDYQINYGTIQTIWSILEKNEGLSYSADVDLSSLAGQNVKFILTTFAAGSPTDDKALWIAPRIVR